MPLRANPTYPGASSPFYSNTPPEVNPTQGVGYAPAANANNLLVAQTLQRLGVYPSGGPGGHLDTPMYESPYAGRAGVLTDALTSMSGRESAAMPYGSARSAQVGQQDIAATGSPLLRALTVMEPARRQQLIQLLLSAYGLDASMFQGYTQGQTQARNIDTAAASGRAGALGGIPIVGGLLAGVGA